MSNVVRETDEDVREHSLLVTDTLSSYSGSDSEERDMGNVGKISESELYPEIVHAAS